MLQVKIMDRLDGKVGGITDGTAVCLDGGTVGLLSWSIGNGNPFPAQFGSASTASAGHCRADLDSEDGKFERTPCND
jgi:hypothetical protein